MFKSFSDMKKTPGSFEALQKQVAALAKGGFSKTDDNTKWKLVTDKSGNGSAIIRFLPAPKGEEFSVVKLYTHGFEGPTGKWWIDNCPTTIGEICPACESNTILWNSGEAGQEIVSKERKRKLQFISNILVVKDPKNPDNDGKVFRFSYGPRIMAKITSAMKPSDDEIALGTEAVEIFNLWEGANFRLTAKKVAGQQNYDDSKFDIVSSVAETDEEIEAIWESEHSLASLVAADQFKSYDDLRKRILFVLGKDALAPIEATDEPEATEAEPVVAAEAKAPKAKAKAEKPAPVAKEPEAKVEAVDDDAEYFASLAKKKK